MGGDRHGQNIAQCWPSVLIGEHLSNKHLCFTQSHVPMFSSVNVAMSRSDQPRPALLGLPAALPGSVAAGQVRPQLYNQQ